MEEGDLASRLFTPDGFQQSFRVVQVGAHELARVGEADECDELIDGVRRARHGPSVAARRMGGEGEDLGTFTHETGLKWEKRSPDPRGRGFQ